MTTTEFITQLKNHFSKYLNENGEAKKSFIISFNEGVNTSGFIKFIRKAFPYNYVEKRNKHTFYVYTGDKETQKLLNQPLKGYKPISKSKFIKDCVNDLKRGLNMI